jgi:predicted site-specific integrase-resolvase
MSVASPSDAERWLRLRAAADRLGISLSAMSRIARSGAIRIRRLPGTRPRVSADDVERLAREYTTGGKQQGGQTR